MTISYFGALIILFISLSAVAAIFIVTGLIPLVISRPLIRSSRWARIVLILAFSPLFILKLGAHNVNTIISFLIWAYILVLVWRQSNSYMILGISNPALRDSLIATLGKLSLTFHEDITGFTIEPENILVETNSYSGGLSRITFTKNADPAFERIFLEALRQYYATNQVEISRYYCIFYLVGGLLILASFIILCL